MGAFIKNIIGFKGRKDYINIFELNVVITSVEERGDNNFNNSDNDKDYKKIKIFKSNKYYSERKKLEF